jgi:hypothetical protein
MIDCVIWRKLIFYDISLFDLIPMLSSLKMPGNRIDNCLSRLNFVLVL